MCLAYPARLLVIESESSPKMGTVDFGGVRAPVCLEWLPGVSVGDYVVIHVGFAISKLDEEEAQGTLQLLREALKADEETNALH